MQISFFLLYVYILKGLLYSGINYVHLQKISRMSNI